ncbi:MAG: hypothetical protein E7270_08185 [Lachnospiraceae bacterium]|nr:hypothetical protein [Lachnospiraceae bacterium]
MSQFRIKVKAIVKYENKYLIVKKWYDDNIFDPYKWEFIDGMLNFGDTPEHAAAELVNEITGLNVDVEKILYTWTYHIGEVQYLGITYLCEVDSDIVVLSEDLHDCKWVEAKEFSEYIDNEMLLGDIYKALEEN